MFAEEWPLLMFTLLSQLAIGSYVLLIVAQALLAPKDPGQSLKMIKPGMAAVGPVMALALILSLFHLGKPLSAYLSILQLGSSWLSREILFAVTFFVLWAVSYYLLHKGKEPGLFSLIGILAGLGAVVSMAGIYSTSIRPAWTDINTYIVFFGTTFVLGVLGATAAIAYGTRNETLSEPAARALKKLAVIGAAALILPLLYLPVFVANLSSGGGAALASAQVLSGYGFQLLLRWTLSLVGLGMLFYSIYKAGKTQKRIALEMVCLSGALILAGEFLGRYIFYATAVSIMIG